MGKKKKPSSQPSELPIEGLFPQELTDIGNALGNTYGFEGQIARGKTGVAFKLRSRVNNHYYCLKTIQPEITDTRQRKDIRDTLQKEVEILLPLAHRCLPRIYERDFSGSLPYYVCSWHPGQTFEDYRKGGHRLTVQESSFVITQLFSAFKYLNSQGRTHCDLHAKNILIGDDVLAHGILIIDLGSGHRESDPSPDTVNRGNIFFKDLDEMSHSGAKVNRLQNRNLFKDVDFHAVGMLLGTMRDTFFGEGSTVQQQAYQELCQKLTGSRLHGWDQVERAFLSVLDPFRALAEVNTLFFSSEGLPQSITLPISKFVPVGHKPLQVINTRTFQRLRGIKQLSFCDWIFPGANHTRFEHSLGVFGLAKRAVDNLVQEKDFRDLFDSDDLKGLLLAALLHDVGHYPFAHILEQYTATRLPDSVEAKRVVSHSDFSLELLKTDDQLQQRIRESWGESALNRAVRLMDKSRKLPILYDLLDGAIDLDKIDYLARDALHCGVPFGSSLDTDRLLSSFCLVKHGSGIGVKGHAVPLVEGLMVLQHQMLASVYWQEHVRGIICMFHAVLAYLLRRDLPKIKAFASDLKGCKSDAEGWIVLKRWIDERGGGRKEALHGLIAPHVNFDFTSIYVPIKRYRSNDSIPKGHLDNVHQAILSQTTASGSGLPINWARVRELHSAYFTVFKQHVTALGKADIVVDVPFGKGSHHSITIKDETSGQEADITDLSHLNPSIFDRPAAYVSPIRVYISPKVFNETSGMVERVTLEAEDLFLRGKIEDDSDEHDP